jgi:hypothetical protein
MSVVGLEFLTAGTKFKKVQANGTASAAMSNLTVNGNVTQATPTSLSNVNITGSLTYNTNTTTSVTFTDCNIGVVANSGTGIVTISRAGTTTISTYSDAEINYLDSSLTVTGATTVTAYPTATDRNNDTNSLATWTGEYKFKYQGAWTSTVYLKIDIDFIAYKDVTLVLGDNIVDMGTIGILSSIQTKLNTDLDVAISTRLATAGYTAPANSDISSIKTKFDTLTEDVGGLRFTAKALEEAPHSGGGGGGGGGGSLSAADVWNYSSRTLTTAIPTAAQNATAVRAELSTELGRIDVATSTRLASASYVAPANSDITAIKAKTDNLPSDPADQSLIIDATNALSSQISSLPTAPSASIVASAVRTELSTEMNRIDVNVSSRNAVAPLDSTATQAAAAAALASYDPPTKAELDSAIASIPAAPSSSANASAVRSELATELSRIDTSISSRNAVAPDNANIALIKAKVDTLENADLSGLATSAELEEVKKNTDLIPATV